MRMAPWVSHIIKQWHKKKKFSALKEASIASSTYDRDAHNLIFSCPAHPRIGNVHHQPRQHDSTDTTRGKHTASRVIVVQCATEVSCFHACT